MTYQIHPIVLGTKMLDKGMMTYQHDYGTPYTIPIYAWYLEGGDQTILVDTGERSPIQSAEREQAIGGKIYTFAQGLARYGLEPGDVDIVLHTHLHNDHCENDALCTNARIYVHEKELDHLYDPHPLDFRYMEDFLFEVQERDQIVRVTGDTEVVPGITLIHTPAHTAGGLSVRVQTPEGSALICGFCTILENLNPPPRVRAMDMEVIPPGTHLDANEAYDILVRAKTLADHLLPLHEPRWASLDTVP